MKSKFPERIKELRQERAITQLQLAESISVSARSVSYWESGKRECDFDTLLLLAEFFNVSTDYLLGKI